MKVNIVSTEFTKEWDLNYMEFVDTPQLKATLLSPHIDLYPKSVKMKKYCRNVISLKMGDSITHYVFKDSNLNQFMEHIAHRIDELSESIHIEKKKNVELEKEIISIKKHKILYKLIQFIDTFKK